MMKETGYQEKFVLIKPWLTQVIETVKKDLRQEHLKIDRNFCKRHFMGKQPQHVTVEEMVPAYEKEIAEGNIGLGEFIATRWLLKNTDIYGYFEKELSPLTPDFDELEDLDPTMALPLMKSSLHQFGALRTYLFCVLNSVVFSDELYEQLHSFAEEETTHRAALAKEQAEAVSLEGMQKKHTREVSALTDRFEKKLSGMQRKYLRDMEGLKKQISTLQKKLSEK